MTPAFDPDEIREWDKTTSAPNPTLGAYGGLLPFDASIRYRFPNRVVTEGWGRLTRYANVQRMLNSYDQVSSEVEFQSAVVPFLSAHRVPEKEHDEQDLLAEAFRAARQSEDLPTGVSNEGVSSGGEVAISAINMRSLYGSDLWNDIDVVREIRRRDISNNTYSDPADASQLRIVEIGYC